FFFFQAEDGIRDRNVTGVQTCALPISVEAARLELETYRATIKVSDVGAEAWKQDVATRQAALDLARGELRSLPAPPRDPYAVPKIGRASCRERGEIPGGAVACQRKSRR